MKKAQRVHSSNVSIIRLVAVIATFLNSDVNMFSMQEPQVLEKDYLLIHPPAEFFFSLSIILSSHLFSTFYQSLLTWNLFPLQSSKFSLHLLISKENNPSWISEENG
jgi:hypothetical protein